jgi:hypothetical protein
MMMRNNNEQMSSKNKVVQKMLRDENRNQSWGHGGYSGGSSGWKPDRPPPVTFFHNHCIDTRSFARKGAQPQWTSDLYCEQICIVSDISGIEDLLKRGHAWPMFIPLGRRRLRSVQFVGMLQEFLTADIPEEKMQPLICGFVGIMKSLGIPVDQGIFTRAREESAIEAEWIAAQNAEVNERRAAPMQQTTQGQGPLFYDISSNDNSRGPVMVDDSHSLVRDMIDQFEEQMRQREREKEKERFEADQQSARHSGPAVRLPAARATGAFNFQGVRMPGAKDEVLPEPKRGAAPGSSPPKKEARVVEDDQMAAAGE